MLILPEDAKKIPDFSFLLMGFCSLKRYYFKNFLLFILALPLTFANIQSMPHIPKPNLVIGSVLRPVDDHRMYGKLGIHIAALDVCQVHIVGFCSQGNVRNGTILFHPLFDFPRMSVRRFLSPIGFLKKIIQLKPETVIVNSPDLLIVTILYKILFGKKIFYDVLENHAANILFANTYPLFVRRPLAFIVRLVESLSRPFVEGYWLAERAYEHELPFVKGKYTLIENRFAPLTDVVVKPRRGSFRLLYAGTISESYGVFEAIALAKRLFAADSRFCLTLIGYAAQPSIRRRVYEECAGCPYIELIGIGSLVPHSRILESIRLSDIGLLPYRVNDAVKHRIPTKFYEYAAFSLPMIISQNPFWEDSLAAYSTSTHYVDFHEASTEDIIFRIHELTDTGFSNYSIDATYYTYIFSNLRNAFH